MLLVQGKRSSCNELVKTSYKCDNKKGTIQNNMKIKSARVRIYPKIVLQN